MAAEAGYPAERCAAIAQLTLASGLTELFPFSITEPFYAVLARQAPNGKWYVAGINATDAPKAIQVDLGKLGLASSTLITWDSAKPRSASPSRSAFRS